MGSPEFPSDSGESDLRPHINQAVLVESEDSDNDDYGGNYDGYQRLPFVDIEDTMDIDNIVTDDPPTTARAVQNLPFVESVDTEVVRDVWSEPRPRELQIDLDHTRTQQV